MSRVVMVVVLLAVLAPALGAAEPALLIGKRLRLATTSPQGDSSKANPARVVREDANSITLAAPGEGPITRTREGRWLVGQVVATDDGLLTLRVADGTGRVIVRRQDITSMALSEGRASRGKGALVGAVVGAGVGVLAGYAAGDDPPGWFAFTAGQKAAAFALLLTPIGTLIGLVAPREERWTELRPDRIGLNLTSVRGSEATISLRFTY